MSDEMKQNPSAPDEAGYKVGKGKPPLHTQFKKGNKAGKGRPKGSKNISTIVNHVISTKVKAKINGKAVSLSNTEYVLMQMASKARAGDFKCMKEVVALHERYGPQEDPAGPPPEEVSRDIEVLRDYLAMYDKFGGAKTAEDHG